jgi:Arc/MetJ-type ribon-helix-helix transcriptional regulator
MKRSIAVVQKKRGRPATGQDPVTAIRLSPDLRERVDKWAARQGSPSRSEAIRRLVEVALAGTHAPSQPSKGSTRLAANLAAREIDQLVDKAATGEERDRRKRRLIAGPKEFRGIRRK